MTDQERKYANFMQTICEAYGCKPMARFLIEGFRTLCESEGDLVLFRAHDSAYDTLSANPWCWCSDSEEYAASYCKDNPDKKYVVDRFAIPWSSIKMASTEDIAESMKKHSLDTFGETSVSEDGLTESDLWQFGFGENDWEIRKALLDDGFNCFRFPEDGSMQYCVLDIPLLGYKKPTNESVNKGAPTTVDDWQKIADTWLEKRNEQVQILQDNPQWKGTPAELTTKKLITKYDGYYQNALKKCKALDNVKQLPTNESIMMESASSVLYHFMAPDNFGILAEENRFTPSEDEQNLNGQGMRYMSFSRTGSFREGFPILLQSDCGYGADWGVVRLTLDGDLLNRYNTFKVGQGRGKPKVRHNMKFKPFDWSYHDYGPNFGDEYDIDERIDNGKEWMMKSTGSFDVSIPYDDSTDPMSRVYDNEGHPYSQAEDRMVTTASIIPNASRFIKCVDIIVNLSNFRDDNANDRQILFDCIKNSNLKRKIHIYTSVRDCEHRRDERNLSILLSE